MDDSKPEQKKYSGRYGKRRFKKYVAPESRPKYTLAQAKYRVMDLMATRDHTLKEIQKKLKPRCEEATLKELLTWLSEQTWLPEESKIQEQVVHALGRRKKGQNYINRKLNEMGLKSVQLNNENELEKALDCIQNKWDKDDLKGLDFKKTQKAKAKVIRFLAGRGFNLSVASKAYTEYFKKTKKFDNEGEDYDEEY